MTDKPFNLNKVWESILDTEMDRTLETLEAWNKLTPEEQDAERERSRAYWAEYEKAKAAEKGDTGGHPSQGNQQGQTEGQGEAPRGESEGDPK